jgi:AcrR family transcriptional regulator
MEATEDNGKAALVIAHPGHELCVHGWLETARPLVFVLTDGSGRSGVSRLNSTSEILADAGASVGSIYGRFTDQNLYTALLNGDFGLFEQIVAELAEALVRENVAYVAGDAIEGYNPIHDVCRMVINAAVAFANRMSDRVIANRDFLLLASHHTHSEEVRGAAIWLTLDDERLRRKLAVARAYPELKGEVDARLDKMTLERMQAFPELSARFDSIVMSEIGSEAYRIECLRLVSSPPRNGAAKEIPFYERYGELLVAAGIYDRAIRYRDHVVPLAEAIWRFVDGND